MGRSPSNTETKGLKKGPWTPEEDRKLMDYIQKHGHGSWPLLPRRAGLNRCGKSCRLRWTNYLRPDIKRGNFSPEEEQAIIHLHSSLGNKWSMIASHLPGRTDNEIKNFWNAHLRKKLLRSGIDPNTHRPITNFSFPVNPMTSPLENLAKIRMLQSVLQILTADNPLPSFCRGWRSETVNQFDRPFDGMLSPLNAPPALPNLDSGNLSRTSPPFLDTFKTTTEVGLVGGLSVVNCTSNINNTENWLPGLVPGTPDISSVNQVKSTHSSAKNQNYDDHLFIPENSGGWDTVEMDDEDIGSFWKDIFDESFLSSFS